MMHAIARSLFAVYVCAREAQGERESVCLRERTEHVNYTRSPLPLSLIIMIIIIFVMMSVRNMNEEEREEAREENRSGRHA